MIICTACMMLLVALAAWTVPHADAHSLFNSAEQTIGDYRMQVATLPEFPQVDQPAQVLFRLTDSSLNEVDGFEMGVRIFFNGQQIDAVAPQDIARGHHTMHYTFGSGGNHIFKVDVYGKGSDTITYTFNMSTQSPFGYIFIAAIITGATMFAIIMAYIYAPRLLRRWR